MKERYERYKDSGVPWIGQVPAGWECVKMKYYISIKSGDIISSNDLKDDGVFPVYGGGEQIAYCDSFNAVENDIIVGRVGARCGCITLPQKKCWATDNALIISTKNIDLKFVFYVLLAANLNQYNESNAQPLITSTKVKNLYIPLPPLPEQRAIASFLNARCAAIDAYVASLEREAGLARELKQAVIARAVTRSLDPNTPMRDSGIPWIGQVPKGWEVDELGRHFRERRTKVSDKEYEPLSVSKQGITPQLETACKTDNGDNRKLVCKGDFVVNSRSDRKGSCGLSDYEGSVSLINTVLTPIDMDGKYCHYLFRSNDYIEEFYRLGRGIVADLWTTRYDDMKVLKIPIPPLSEQHAIAVYLDERCAAIDAYVASLEREAGLARELKQREIADAVTGKVKITA